VTDDAEVAPRPGTRRRPLRKAAGGVTAVAAVGASVRVLGGGSGDPWGPGALMLETHETSDLASLELPVDGRGLRSAGPGRWRSPHLDTTTYTMAAFIWAADSKASPALRVRSRRSGVWGQWTSVPPLHGGVDPGVQARPEHTGTELLWTGSSTGIQYEVVGARPDRLRLVLLYPKPRQSDTSLVLQRSAALSRTASAALRPSLFSREDWGADETWRNGRPAFNHVMRQVHVHHTANGNTYSRDEVPTLIRGIYRYHTHYLGWSDVAYNFLVDRFGGIWEGRAGGPERWVRGAHTRGFNSSSTGVAVIGNFDQVRPGSSVLGSVAQIAAWRLHEGGGWPRGKVRVRSEGSDLYDIDDIVLLRAIDGHRDTNETACPGRYLYDALPVIRRRAGKLVRAAQAASQPVRILSAATISGTASVGNQLVLEPGTYEPADAVRAIVWLRDGAEIAGATELSYLVGPQDFGATLSARVTATYEGRAPAEQVAPPMGPVTAVPSARLRSAGGRGRARVEIEVTPPDGVSASPVGDVEVSVAGHRRSVRLVDGKASARFKGLRAGRRRVSVKYLGAGGLAPVEVQGVVRIARP
jgi:hypothetical protein